MAYSGIDDRILKEDIQENRFIELPIWQQKGGQRFIGAGSESPALREVQCHPCNDTKRRNRAAFLYRGGPDASAVVVPFRPGEAPAGSIGAVERAYCCGREG